MSAEKQNPFPAIHGFGQRLFVQKPVVKLLSSLWAHTRGERLKHNKRLWPYVKLTRDRNGLIERVRVSPCKWNFDLTPIDEVPFPQGEIGHILLSGPSIKEIDYSQLQMPVLMGVNGSIALCQKYDLDFKYYAIIDDSFIRCRRELAREIVARDLTLFVRANVLRTIAHHIDPREIKCRIVAFDEVDTPSYLPRPLPAELHEKSRQTEHFAVFDAERFMGFSENPRNGIFGARTVAYDALQLMIWLGMKTIYFHGLDMGNAGTTPRFYETKTTAIGTTLDRNFKSTIEPSFRYAGKYLRERGFEIYNLSLNSALDDDVFPRVDWKERLVTKNVKSNVVD